VAHARDEDFATYDLVEHNFRDISVTLGRAVAKAWYVYPSSFAHHFRLGMAGATGRD